jgi:hypothetical protein
LICSENLIRERCPVAAQPHRLTVDLIKVCCECGPTIAGFGA